jgi:hypothetical protein
MEKVAHIDCDLKEGYSERDAFEFLKGCARILYMDAGILVGEEEVKGCSSRLANLAESGHKLAKLVFSTDSQGVVRIKEEVPRTTALDSATSRANLGRNQPQLVS